MASYPWPLASSTSVSSSQTSEDSSATLGVAIFISDNLFPHGGPFSFTVNLFGKISLQVWALPTFTVLSVKEYIHEMTGVPPDHLRLIRGGVQLPDESLLVEFKICEDSEVWAVTRLLGGGSRGAVRGIAQAIQDWDGIIPVCNKRVQKLFTGDIIEVYRVIDEHWLEGANPATPRLPPFYLPKEYVIFTKIVDPSLESQLHRMNPNFSVQENLPLVPNANRKSYLQRLLSGFEPAPDASAPAELQSSAPPHSYDGFSAASRIPLPPPPQDLPIYDRFLKELRVAMFLSFRPDNTLVMNLSLISSPNRRVRDATIRLTFHDGIILEMQPAEYLECTSTTTTHSRDTSKGLSSSLGTATPLMQQGTTKNSSTSSRVEFTRKTSSSVVGDGVGSSIAYWVLREDPGEGGRHGLAPHFEMSVRLSLHPVSAECEVKATVVTGEAEAGNWFNTRSISSGKKRVRF